MTERMKGQFGINTSFWMTSHHQALHGGCQGEQLRQGVQ